MSIFRGFQYRMQLHLHFEYLQGMLSGTKASAKQYKMDMRKIDYQLKGSFVYLQKRVEA